MTGHGTSRTRGRGAFAALALVLVVAPAQRRAAPPPAPVAAAVPIPLAPPAAGRPASHSAPARIARTAHPLPVAASADPSARNVACRAAVQEIARFLSGGGPRRGRPRVSDWLRSMQDVADDRVRAAGWFIALGNGDTSGLDRLATLAASSADPVLQALAQRACRTRADANSACQALPVDAWVQLEPDNAAAWLALAADPRVDADTQLEALSSAAHADRFDTHLGLLNTLAASARPAEADAADRVAMSGKIETARADWIATEALRMHCNAAALGAEDRRGDCAAIADALQSQAQTLPDLQQALELGRRLGWPDARVAALRDGIAALAAVAQARAPLEGIDECT